MLTDVKARVAEISSRQAVLSGELDPKKESKFLEFCVRLIPRALNAERCSVFIHDPANGKVWLKTGTKVAERGIEVSVADSIVGRVIESGEAHIASELQARDGVHKRIDTTTGFLTRQIVCVPIHSTDGSRITGAIEVLNKNDGREFTEDDVGFLTDAGEQFQSIVEGIFLGQEAVDISRELVTTASRALIATAVMALTSGGFLIALIYAALQSRAQ